MWFDKFIHSIRTQEKFTNTSAAGVMWEKTDRSRMKITTKHRFLNGLCVHHKTEVEISKIVIFKRGALAQPLG